MASHSSVLAWRIPGTGEPGGLPSMGSHRVGHDWSDLAVAVAADVGNLIFGSSAFSKISLNIRKFTVHVLLKTGLKNFEHYFTSMWDECNCVVVRAFFREGNGTPLQYSCLENPMDCSLTGSSIHGVAKSWTRLRNFTFTFHFDALEKEMAPTPMFLPGESQGWGSLVGCHLWGRTESDMTEVT